MKEFAVKESMSAKEIKDIRREFGLTQKEFAKRGSLNGAKSAAKTIKRK